MYSDEVIFEFVDLVYSAAADPAAWSVLLERLASVLRGNIATVHHQHLAALDNNILVNWNLDPAAVERYAAHYGPLNVWFTTRPEMHRQGNVYTSQMLCPDALLIGTEFYDDWAAPFGMQQGVGATVLKSGPISTHLSVFRLKEAAPFGEQELKLLRALMPHLQRAFQVHSRVQALDHKRAAAADALDQLPQGVVVLGAKGRVLLVNRAAAALFAAQKALRLTPHGLFAAIPSENRRLNALIQGAITTGSGNGVHSGGAMTISRDGFHGPLQVLVTPLRTKTIYLGTEVPVVAIFISGPDPTPLSSSAEFAQLYQLSPAETRLARMLANGESMKAAAEKLGVAQSTLRSQLKSIFAKTNTSRQSELVRLLWLVPPRTDPRRTLTTTDEG